MLALIAAVLGGCSAPGVRHGPEVRPEGFTLAASVQPAAVQSAAGSGSVEAVVPRARRAARYVVETEGLLRVATGPALSTPGGAYPPQVRRLTPPQVDELWRLAREARLNDPAHPGAHRGRAPVVKSSGPAVAVFELTTDFEPRVVIVTLDDSPEGQSASRLLDHLAALAWIAE